MEALQEMKEPTGDAAPANTAPADEKSFFSVPEDEYAIADEDILATTSHEVFNPQGVPPPEITEADVVGPHPVLEEVPVVAEADVPEVEATVPAPEQPDVPVITEADVPVSEPVIPRSSELEVPVVVEPELPEPESSVPTPEQPDVSIVAQAEAPPPEPAVTEQVQPELVAVETGDPPEIAAGSDSSSEMELDLDNVGHIPENMGPPPKVIWSKYVSNNQSGASWYQIVGEWAGLLKPEPVVAEPNVPEPVVAPKAVTLPLASD
jgi:hypothetical protein